MVYSLAWNGRGELVVDPEKDKGLRGAKRTVWIDLITLQNRSVDAVTSAFMDDSIGLRLPTLRVTSFLRLY